MNMYFDLTFRYFILHCESRFFSKMVKFGLNNRIKTTSISFTTVHFIFYPLF